MKTADAISQILKREGVEWVIGYPVNHILERAAAADIRPVIVRQERIGVHMAEAISRVTSGRKLGVFAMQHGPGTENAYGGVAQAYSESVPILVLPMGYARQAAWSGPPLQRQRQHGGRGEVGGAGDVGQADTGHLPPCVHAAQVGTRRAGAGGGARRRVERGDRRNRSCAGGHLALGPRSRCRARGRRHAAQGQAAGALCRAGRALGGSVGRSCPALGAIGYSRLHEPAGQERVPRDASACAGFRRPGDHGAGQPLPARGRPDLRHRLQLRGDQLRREDAGGQDDHPRHARSRRRQPRRRLRAGGAGRCQAGARRRHRGGAAPGRQGGEGPGQGRSRDQGDQRRLACAMDAQAHL